jgi:hypothetical protein
VGAAQGNERRTVRNRRGRVVDDNRASRPQRVVDQLGLPPGGFLVVAEPVLADVLMRGGKVGAVERGLPGSLQADQNDEIRDDSPR